MKNFGLTLNVFLLAAISSGGASSQDIPTIVFRGSINEKSASDFINTLKRHPEIRRVRISSIGGRVDYALNMAEEIYNRSLDIEIDGECLSSCANYIFPAAKVKYITDTGLVAWHGNVIHLNYISRIRNTPGMVPKIELSSENARREVAFFSRIGVDQFICWFGKLPPFNAIGYYTLSQSDMHRFGINNVRTSADYPHGIIGSKGRGSRAVEYISVNLDSLNSLRSAIDESRW